MNKQAEQPGETPGATGGDMIVFDLRELAAYSDAALGVTVLSDIGAARVVLFAFRAGQQLKEHETSSQILVQVLRGRIRFLAAGRSVALRSGMLVQLEARARHSLVAQTDAVVLVTMMPSPHFHSLEHAVFEQHAPLVSRVDNNR
jgi:quercetin dioxygenase-like cupin family protein